MAGPLLTQIDLRLIADPVCVINDPWQASLIPKKTSGILESQKWAVEP